ncbi:MAG: GntR family transcriptional regulator [Planctomycetaceae bacterium]|jgi:DNA-binding GntR family transcriptional regulator|nr:GntR family transcriptional regulator [Planctomycetaceae bacterium]
MSLTITERTLTRRVYESVRDLILDGKFRPGERLVRRKVAKQLGVSYVPVTEALYMLEHDGLVENLPKRGCRVRELTLAQFQNDFVIREALECQAARIAAEKGNEEQFSRLFQQAIRLDRILGEADTNSALGVQMHTEFHLAVAQISNLESFIAEIQKIWKQQLARWNWVSATFYKKPPKGWHEQLVREIMSGNPDRAEKMMRQHTQYGTDIDHDAFEKIIEQM